jgi:iron complex transport system substrate-binding protein
VVFFGSFSFDVFRACAYNTTTFRIQVRVPCPRMGRPNGEAGKSPALSRNCELACSNLLTSQAARPDQFHHTPVERRWERLVGLPILPPLSKRQGILFDKNSLIRSLVMLRKFALAWLSLVLIILCCVSCRGASAVDSIAVNPTAQASISLTDGLGRSVTISVPVRSVVSLAASNTEILFAIGAGAQVIGRDSFSDYPAAAKSVQDIGGSMGKYDTEAIVALHPDLVLAGEINTPELVNALEQLGLTVYYLPNPVTLEGMYGNLETVGQLTGHNVEAVKLVDSLERRVAAVDAKISPLSYGPTVYYELDATDPAKPFTAGSGTFVDLLISRAGGINIGRSLKSQWAQISLEQLVMDNPNIIVLGDSAYGVTFDSLKQRAGWAGLAAIQNGQVFPFDDNLVSRPGPRLVDGLEALAKLLHPGVFE